MLEVTKEVLEKLIDKARKAGKDVSALEQELKDGIKLHSKVSYCRKVNRRTATIISTGPVHMEDFE